MAIKTLLTASDAAEKQFRSLQDVLDYLGTVRDKLNDADALMKQYEKVGAKITASEFEFEVKTDPSAGGKKRAGSAEWMPKISKIKVPDLKNLRDNFALVSDIADQVDTLNSLYNSVLVNFKGTRGSGDVLTGIKNMLKVAESKMDRALVFLQKIGKGHLPEFFDTFVSDTMTMLDPGLTYKDSENFVYAFENADGDLQFTYYVQLKGLLDDEGEVYPQFFIIFTCVLRADEDKKLVAPHLFVTVQQDFAVPGKFRPGHEVKSVQNASTAIGSLLELESVSTSIGTLPHNVSQEKLEKTKFSSSELIDKVLVDEHSIGFQFVKSATREQVEQSVRTLYQEVKSMIGAKGASLKARITYEGRQKVVRFTLTNLAGPLQVSVHDLNFLRESFDLAPDKLAQIVKIINS